MQFRNISKLEQLTELVAQKVASQLDFNFEYQLPSCSYNYISENLKLSVIQECTSAFISLPLSQTQLNILEKLDLDHLSNVMAGTLTYKENFCIVNGIGFTSTGITKIYFNSISTNIKKLSLDSLNPLNYVYDISSFSFRGRRYKNKGAATYDVLSGCKKERRREIISFMGDKLLLASTPEQTLHLYSEIRESNNPFISSLLEPRIEGWYKKTNRKNSNLIANYEYHLFNLNSVASLLVTLLEELLEEKYASAPIPKDTAHYIMRFFTPKERNHLVYALPLVNKQIAEVKRYEVNTLCATYRKL